MYEKLTIREIEQKLNTNIEKGLSPSVAKTRLAQNGENILKERKKKNFALIFLEEFEDVLIVILCIASLLSFILNEIADAIIILIIVLFNALVGAIQEYKAEIAINKIKSLEVKTCFCKRDGEFITILSKDLVVGDVVLIEEGSRVPADVRWVETHDLKIEEASLTGESEAVNKNEHVISDAKDLSDKTNMGFMSTTVINGRGIGVVVNTGMNTEIGKIATLLKENKSEETPLQKRLGELGKILGILIVGVCLSMFLISLIEQRNAFEMLITSISVAVAAVPEGLPASVTIVLALGVKRMIKTNTIIRKLHSVETLGAVSIICSDKTGTLTENKMQVVKIWGNDNERLLIEGLTLCNNASISKEERGDPSEVALLKWSISQKIYKDTLEEQYPRIDEISFDSRRKMMSTLHRYNGRSRMFTKGAIDRILPICKYVLNNGQIKELTVNEKEKILLEGQKMGEEALRVFALAIKDNVEYCEEQELVFVGFVGMKDSPRKEVPQSIGNLKKAGITTIMITGDNIDTAYAVAKEIGITSNHKECVLGAEIDKIDDDILVNNIHQYRVFARVSPEHKVKIVKAFKRNNNIVAMTGDGVNDAPSLKEAHVGIAMGKIGTDVAREASDMVLRDDNFASIEKAVAEGRGVYANIKKTVVFLLSSNIGEVLTMLIGIILNIPTPLVAIHVLWVNLITDTLPALALGADPKDKDIMLEKPRPYNESLFAKGGLWTTTFYGIFITVLTLAAFIVYPLLLINQEGLSGNIFYLIKQSFTCGIGDVGAEVILLKSRTYAFTALGLSQLFHMLGMSNTHRSFIHIFKNKNLLMGFAFIFGFILQMVVVEVPLFNNFFQTCSLDVYEWLWIILLSALPLIIHEIIVLLCQRKATR